MPHLHKLETWRHPVTKARATIAQGYCGACYADAYAFRARVGTNIIIEVDKPATRARLAEMGYTHPSLHNPKA